MTAYQVLVVEDQRELARMIRSGLASLGPEFQVLDVPSGEEAQLIASRQRLDLLLIDVKLPGISGLELMQTLQEQQPGLKTILITGLSDQESRRQVATAGADAFFFKPVELGDILETARRLLGLDPVPLPVDEEEAPGPSLSDRLAELRQTLKAVMTAILDDNGKALIQAGELPESDRDASLMPAVMTFHSAGQRLATLLGASPPSNYLFLSGERVDLYLAPLGEQYTLLVAAPHTDPLPLSQVGPTLQSATGDLRDILQTLGVPLEPVPQTGPLEPAADELTDPIPAPPPEFEAALEQATEQPFEADDLETFWDPEGEKVNTGSLSPDSLSYDQARKLGLTPEEDDEDETP